MKLLKTFAKNFVYKFLFYYFYIKFKLIIKNTNVVFDIDNTLAISWPSLVNGCDNEFRRLKNLSVHNNVLNLVNKYLENGENIIFLSARDYRYYMVTRNWLRRHINGQFGLILVSKPSEKVSLFAANGHRKFVFYDDMSYSHENGIVKFYHQEINAIKKLDFVDYYGYYDLLRLQGDVDE